jgi:hypothetical protein
MQNHHLTSKRCQRPGCNRYRPDNRAACSGICGAILRLISEGENLAYTIGATPATDKLIRQLFDLNASANKVFDTRAEIRVAAAESGVDADTWRAWLRGQHTTAEEQTQ